MKEGWKYSTIGECCDVNYGTRVVRSQVQGNEYPVYGGGGETFRMDNYNRESILVVARFAMSKQCTRFVEGRFFLNDSGLTVSPKENTTLTQALLNKYLLASNDLIFSMGRGSAQRNLNMNEFRNLKVSYPETVSEQQRIVEYLDSAFAKIDALKAKAKENLDNAQALFQAALTEKMTPKEGWEKMILIKEFSLKSGENLSSRNQMQGSYPVYGGNGITGYHNEYNVSNSCIVIGRVGALCGNIHITEPLSWVTDNAFIVKGVSDKWFFKFLYYELIYLNLNQYASQTAQPVISNKSMKDVAIFCPPLVEQEEVSKNIEYLEKLIYKVRVNFETISTECDALKQALLKQIFE